MKVEEVHLQPHASSQTDKAFACFKFPHHTSFHGWFSFSFICSEKNNFTFGGLLAGNCICCCAFTIILQMSLKHLSLPEMTMIMMFNIQGYQRECEGSKRKMK